MIRRALDQYKKYITATRTIASQMGIRTAHFIQPFPEIGKHLTKAEKQVVFDPRQRVGSAAPNRKIYLRMTQSLLSLNEKGIPVISLLHVFDDVPETIYCDRIHCKRDPETDFSRGYHIMAERMAEEIGRIWKLERR